jgi:hypothetical protein
MLFNFCENETICGENQDDNLKRINTDLEFLKNQIINTCLINQSELILNDLNNSYQKEKILHQLKLSIDSFEIFNIHFSKFNYLLQDTLNLTLKDNRSLLINSNKSKSKSKERKTCSLKFYYIKLMFKAKVSNINKSTNKIQPICNLLEYYRSLPILIRKKECNTKSSRTNKTAKNHKKLNNTSISKQLRLDKSDLHFYYKNLVFNSKSENISIKLQNQSNFTCIGNISLKNVSNNSLAQINKFQKTRRQFRKQNKSWLIDYYNSLFIPKNITNISITQINKVNNLKIRLNRRNLKQKNQTNLIDYFINNVLVTQNKNILINQAINVTKKTIKIKYKCIEFEVPKKSNIIDYYKNSLFIQKNGTNVSIDQINEVRILKITSELSKFKQQNRSDLKNFENSTKIELQNNLIISINDSNKSIVQIKKLKKLNKCSLNSYYKSLTIKSSKKRYQANSTKIELQNNLIISKNDSNKSIVQIKKLKKLRKQNESNLIDYYKNSLFSPKNGTNITKAQINRVTKLKHRLKRIKFKNQSNLFDYYKNLASIIIFNKTDKILNQIFNKELVYVKKRAKNFTIKKQETTNLIDFYRELVLNISSTIPKKTKLNKRKSFDLQKTKKCKNCTNISEWYKHLSQYNKTQKSVENIKEVIPIHCKEKFQIGKFLNYYYYL